MQEIKKRRILLASVLKPVNDTRMAAKLGRSLLLEYDVHVTGFPAAGTTGDDGLHTHPLPFFKRLTLKRLFVRWKVLRLALRLRPEVMIITTHELLTPALMARLLLRCHVIYDIQENYWRNILYTSAFPTVLRPFLAVVVRLRERLSLPFIKHFFLAEAGYATEINFLPPPRTTVLENKIIRPADTSVLSLHRQYPAPHSLRLLFSGTLAESTGVFTAINLTHALHALDNTVHLTVIGYCALPEQVERLKQACTADYIRLIGVDHLVPHTDIIQAIQTADVGIIAYPPNPATQNAIPTKLFEYLGYHLPILLIDHPVWTQRCAPYNAAVNFSAQEPDAAAILRKLRTQTFYTATPNDVYWDTEAKKLSKILHSILKIRQ